MGLTRIGEKNVSRGEILKLPYLVLVVSMLFTVGATYLFYKNEQAKDLDRFQLSIDRYKNRINNKLRAYVGLLKAGRGFVESNERLNKKAFSAFFNSLEVEKNYPEIIKIGFSKKTSLSESQKLAKQMSAEGFKEFKIFPLSSNAETQPVVYLEPENDLNAAEIGFDLLSDPDYRAAMEQAQITGTAAATGKVFIKRRNEKDIPCILIFMPVYRNGGIPQTEAEKRELSEGFIYDFVNAEDFLKDAQNTAAEPDIAVAVYENEINPRNLIAGIGGDFLLDNRHLTTTSEAEIADKKWVVGFQALPSFENRSGINWTPFIFAVGIVFSLLFFGTTYLETYARAKAEKITSELRESEREKGFLLELEQKARRKVEDASRIKDEFISVVSHELRTPLNSISGWSRILRGENISENIKSRALDSIEKNVRHQTGIVEDLLELSQILSETPDFKKREVNISGVFQEVFSEFEEPAKSKHIDLINENNLNGQKIIGDGEQLKKVFKKLFSNAIKFTPEGGRVLARMDNYGDVIEIKVADNGRGIEPEILPNIFESFRQADSSTTRCYGGLGLGLSIVRRIVELHGGEISAFSKGAGNGTKFVITLPLSDSHKTDNPEQA